MRALPIALAAFLIGGIAATDRAAAAPTVTVKARTAIELDGIRRVSGGVLVRGHLVDHFSRAAISWASIHVRLDQFSRPSQSDSDGAFDVHFSVTEGQHDVVIEYEGDSHHTASIFEVTNFDVAKNPLSLELSLGSGVVDFEGGELEIIVKATSDGEGVAVSVPIFLGNDGDAADALRRIASVNTDDNGRGTWKLVQPALGEPGRKRLEARFAGDEAFDAATDQSTLLVTTGTATTFSIASTDFKYESKVRGKGRVVNDAGEGIGGAAVAFVIGSRRISEGLTEDDGRFTLSVSASEVGHGKHNVQAVFDPTKAWRRSSRSEPVTITVAKPEPIPVRYTIAAFAATAVIILAFVGLRTKPWQKWLARWRKSRAKPADEELEPAESSAPIQTGLQLARPSLVSTLRRTKDSGFTGQIRHALNGRPVGGASITLDHDEHGLETTDARGDGHFAFDRLAPGEWRCSVSAFGYVTEQFAITVPHRGELRGARIDLLPVRERIFAMYGEAAKPLLPDPAFWGIWTPKEIFDHVRGERPPASALRDLTDFVEETYFSQRTPQESAIEIAADHIAKASQESRV